MPIDIDMLRSKVPLGQLPDNCLRTLAELSQITHHKEGEVLFNIGDMDDMTVYLVAGTISLVCVDGKVEILKHTNQASRYGLAMLKPRRYRGKALEDGVDLVWIKSTALEQYHRQHKSDNTVDITTPR